MYTHLHTPSPGTLDHSMSYTYMSQKNYIPCKKSADFTTMPHFIRRKQKTEIRARYSEHSTFLNSDEGRGMSDISTNPLAHLPTHPLSLICSRFSVFCIQFSVFSLLFLISSNLLAQSVGTPTSHFPLPTPQPYIIEFDQPPATTLMGSMAKATIDYDQPAQQLLNYLSNQLPTTHSQLPVFKNTFHGLALDLPESLINEIRALPYVKNVYPDHEITHFAYESVYQIQADSVWRHYGTRGAGITIGILDSGIDYNHPSLGGGFGPGFKVIDGWDFVDNDPDPMDEHRHGTHVAGIAAGNNESTHNDPENLPFLGVAPDANLVAYRVLDKNGRGRISDIIAAIERAVDPNQDGDFSDRLDVINLSLGSEYGSPNDPGSTAVNNATLAGVVVVAAAGNSGFVGTGHNSDSNFRNNGSQSIGSPGMAEHAITVGAVDRSLALARFSSKGPVNTTFAIKPDVVAPGVSILSTVPGGAMDAFNGTSMAAPHVAGVAALIRAIHPDWTPAQVKAAITNTAIPLQMPAWHQGTGFIDPVTALKTKTLVSPSQLNFGMTNATQSNWSRSIQITIENILDTPQTYSLETLDLPIGATLTFSQTQITIPAQSNQSISAELRVNHSQIPIVAEDIRTYSGTVIVRSDRDVARIPWSFSRSSVIRLTFTQPDAQVILSSVDDYYTSGNTSRFNQFHWITDQRAEIYAAKPGAFAIVTSFYQDDAPTRLVVNESAIFNGNTLSQNISHGTAIHGVTLSSTDAFGESLDTYDSHTRVLSLAMNNNLITTSIQSPISGSGPHFLVSDVSTEHTIYASQIAVRHDEEPVMVIPKLPSRKGVSGPMIVTATTPLHHIPIHFHTQNYGISDQNTSSSVPTAVIALTGVYESNESYDHQHAELLHILNPIPSSDGISTIHYYVADNQSLNGVFPGTRFLVGREMAPELYQIDLETQHLAVIDTEIRTNLPYLEEIAPVRLPLGVEVNFGQGPIFSFTRPSFNLFGPGSMKFDPLIRGPLHEIRRADYPVSTWRVKSESGEVLFEGALNQISNDIIAPEAITDLEIELQGNQLRGKPVTTTVTSRSDLNKVAASPPWIYSVLLTDQNGIPVESVLQNEPINLMVAGKSVQLMDDIQVDPTLTTIEWRIHGHDSDWNQVEFTHTDPENPRLDGIRFFANLSAATATDSVAIDLRIKLFDANQSSTEVHITPAFAVGNWIGQTETSIEEPTTEQPTRLTLNQNYPNPFNPTTNITFTLPNTSAYTDIRLAVYNLLGQEILRLAEGPTPSGTHTITFNASNLASGLYIYQLTTPYSTLTKKMMLIR